MEKLAFQKIYTKVIQITKATCTLEADNIGYEELASVHGKLAQVVKIQGKNVTLQVFGGTEGIPSNAEVFFYGKPPSIKVSEDLAGRFFNAFGLPIDGGPEVEGEEREAIKKDMEQITGFIEKLGELNTDNVTPLIFMNDEVNRLRDDIPVKSLTHEEILKNAPKKDTDYFRIPKVLDKKNE